MYLIHNTTVESIKSILKNNKLKSYNLLKKEGKKINQNEGDGLYSDNNFVYFSCTDTLFDKRTHGHIILYFDPALVLKSFYVSSGHSFTPNKLAEWTVKNENGEKYANIKENMLKNTQDTKPC
jgi:hypothetical protein